MLRVLAVLFNLALDGSIIFLTICYLSPLQLKSFRVLLDYKHVFAGAVALITELEVHMFISHHFLT
jgi:hypothetical protein